MNEQKSGQDSGSCKTDSKCCCCAGKKFFIGILTGLAIAVIAHCFMCGGGMCASKSSKMCPTSHMQAPAR